MSQQIKAALEPCSGYRNTDGRGHSFRRDDISYAANGMICDGCGHEISKALYDGLIRADLLRHERGFPRPRIDLYREKRRAGPLFEKNGWCLRW